MWARERRGRRGSSSVAVVAGDEGALLDDIIDLRARVSGSGRNVPLVVEEEGRRSRGAPLSKLPVVARDDRSDRSMHDS